MTKAQLLMDAGAVDLSLTRITHQILEHNHPLVTFGIVGMQTRGVYLARRVVDKINQQLSLKLVAGVLDPTLYRDDYRRPFRQPKVQITDIPFNIDGMNVVLVDDVLYTGRTVRAALDALMDFGRPKTIQLAVLVDRGKRELPIRADYVGKEITTADHQEVALYVKERDGEDALWLTEEEEKS
jgi:pyrimidine operon attenuation protein/uracil phosphoribosyltransferase